VEQTSATQSSLVSHTEHAPAAKPTAELPQDGGAASQEDNDVDMFTAGASGNSSVNSSASAATAPAATAPAVSSAVGKQPAVRGRGGARTGTESESDVDSEDDMFSADFDAEAAKESTLKLQETAGVHVDNFDDPDGYYRYRVGETVNSRYKVIKSFGRGVFSEVYLCRDLRMAIVAQERREKASTLALEQTAARAAQVAAAAADLQCVAGAETGGQSVPPAEPEPEEDEEANAATVARDKALSAASAGNFVEDETYVALKVVRNNETMLRAGRKERDILRILTRADPDNKKHVIRLLDAFEFRNHLCLSMEPMWMNLRELVDKYGKDRGLSLAAVRVYAQQLFVALRHIHNHRIMHADLKPDNIVVNRRMTAVKICDLGSASLFEEAEVTPYLVSRYYRAPEIILGLEYDRMIDVWSLGCVLAELFLGRILFLGRDNNDMLWQHFQLKGKPPQRMLKKALLREFHFSEEGRFCKKESDPVTGQEVIRPMLLTQSPVKDIGSILQEHATPGTNPQKLRQFRDLLEGIFALDPIRRFTPEQALRHPFLRP